MTHYLLFCAPWSVHSLVPSDGDFHFLSSFGGFILLSTSGVFILLSPFGGGRGRKYFNAGTPCEHPVICQARRFGLLGEQSLQLPPPAFHATSASGGQLEGGYPVFRKMSRPRCIDGDLLRLSK